jgi:RecA-family ATPase
VTGPEFRFWRERDLAELPPPEWLVSGLLPAGGLSVVYGPSGVGKSFVALSIAACVARGRAWLDRHTCTGRVVYIAAEGAYGLPARLSALKEAYSLQTINRLIIVPDTVHLHNEHSLAAYLHALRHYEPKPIALTVIDTLSRCSSGSDESNNAHRELTVDGLNEIRRATKGGVLAVHHTGWKTDHMRGGSALLQMRCRYLQAGEGRQ